uniref:uncharacterized protein LOC124032144 isoform X2 n=1 Tax=Oncorhynchus gorbuscha TaxID=8017 RepID=UPI001EAF2AB5|nr:uncharacterized protein LOC124032144 isoform X2 [Oncorhynchus gorbuscha]
MHKRYHYADLGWVYVMASLALSDSLLIIQAECNEDVSMKCEAVQDKSYRSVTWYKISPTCWVWTNGQSSSSQSQAEDAGTYQCLLRANIGQTNRDSKVTLNVSTDCVIHTTVAVTAWQNVTYTTPMCPIQLVEVSVIWTSCGFLILGLVKIALCLISMGVVRNIKRSHSRRKKQQQW